MTDGSQRDSTDGIEAISRHAARGHVARNWLPGAEHGPKETARKWGC